MAAKLDNSDDDSFIILSTSPATSLDLHYNGEINRDLPMDKTQLEEVLKDLSLDASMALKAQFHIGDNPSPSSMMIASNLVSEDKTIEELQKKFGELLDENVLLKETLQKNNDSMKDQFFLIASCQDDMMKTHKVHKEKFDETRQLIVKLHEENKKLKYDISMLSKGDDSAPTLQTNGEGDCKEISSPNLSGVYEFVTSPDDDTMNKLTAQLELVEKQRRQVIVDNDKLTWQKESLERIVDSAAKERQELQGKLKEAELQHSNREAELVSEITTLKKTVQQLGKELTETKSLGQKEEIQRNTIKTLEQKVTGLQTELKNSQLKMLDLENMKLEYSRLKCNTSETLKIYKDQLQDLQNRLKDAQTIVFQPIRFSVKSESENANALDSGANIKLYDETLKHLAEMLNSTIQDTSEVMFKSMDVLENIQEFKLERTSIEKVRVGVLDMRQSLEKQHTERLHRLGQIRSALTIFEGIFQDYKEMSKSELSKSNAPAPQNMKNEQDIAALKASQAEAKSLQIEVHTLRAQLAVLGQDRDDIDLLRAQNEIFRSDFEAERDARQKMASDKESALADLRLAQKNNQSLLEQLEEVRKLNPHIYAHATVKRPKALTRSSPFAPQASNSAPKTNGGTSPSQKTIYKCPKCMSFSSDQYKVLEDHFDFCLDDF